MLLRLKTKDETKNAAKRSRQHVRIHRKLSSTKGCIPPKVVFHQRSSPTKGCLPLKVVFYKRLSSTEVCLPPKVVFHRRTYRGGRTHNVTKQTDTQIFFDTLTKRNITYWTKPHIVRVEFVDEFLLEVAAKAGV